jgi:hypothetical protein
VDGVARPPHPTVTNPASAINHCTPSKVDDDRRRTTRNPIGRVVAHATAPVRLDRPAIPHLAHTIGAVSADIHASYLQARQAGTYELEATVDAATAARRIPGILRALPDVASGSSRYTVAFEAARLRMSRYRGNSPSSSGAGGGVVFGVDNGRDVGWLAGIPTRVAAVTYADIAKLATTELPIDRAVIVIIGPHDAVAATYAELGTTPMWLH